MCDKRSDSLSGYNITGGTVYSCYDLYGSSGHASSHLEMMSKEPTVQELRDDLDEINKLFTRGEISKDQFEREKQQLERQLKERVSEKKANSDYLLFCDELERRACSADVVFSSNW